MQIPWKRTQTRAGFHGSPWIYGAAHHWCISEESLQKINWLGRAFIRGPVHRRRRCTAATCTRWPWRMQLLHNVKFTLIWFLLTKDALFQVTRRLLQANPRLDLPVWTRLTLSTQSPSCTHFGSLRSSAKSGDCIIKDDLNWPILGNQLLFVFTVHTPSECHCTGRISRRLRGRLTNNQKENSRLIKWVGTKI